MEIRSASAASFVLLLLLSLSSFLKLPAGAELFSWQCYNGSSYKENGTYQSNVRSLLASLAANVSRSQSLFATTVVGTSSDTVWGLGLCRGDITNRTECTSCLALAPEVAFDKSRGASKEAVIPHDAANRYDALVVSLAVALATAAFNSTSRYATGVMVSDQGFTTNASDDVVRTIYGLVQCTPDKPPGPCRECLQGLVDGMKFNGSVGGHIFGIWCNIRFEKQVFYDGSPMLNLIAPPPTPPPSPLPSGTTDGTRWRQRVATVSTIVLGVAVILLSITVVFLWRNKATTQLSYQEDGDDPESLLFDLTTLRRATDNFAQENKLGHGGFGAVYKGVLPHGREIAVKRLDKASGQGLKELRNELLLVAKLKHNNLTKLLGVCLKGEEKLLVYEYLPNRSLDTFLFAPEIEKRLLLSWETRFRIIYGTARGLLYLHEDSQIKIIHRDLKASNILLDTDMNPKISDFGLARLFNSDKPSTTTGQVIGTLGYMAPEYAVLGHLSVKIDVYSFGVLVLEIVTGRKNTDAFEESSAGESGTLLNYVWDQWSKGTALVTMDPMLECMVAEEGEVLKCVHLGLLCVQENPADRPTMLEVLVMLHGHASSFVAPSKPAFTFPFASSTDDIVLSASDPGVQSASATPSVNEMSVSEFEPR
ncbi:Cysteine-rich receptor-like protein kinase 25 [Triticum urartu]|uniref:Cysteine-rich receptor-like protein kinase 25 n=1 Tax=Triticum urartu TaxID=4572 RepID=M8AAZ2_TRIUA|nr:Cysteine-rich receptor-like protein kinase 25 [Triticum urartu]